MMLVTVKEKLATFFLVIACVPGRSQPSVDNLHPPSGFEISIFAEDLGKARFMAISSEGVLFISSLSAGIVYALPDRGGDGVADRQIEFATNLDKPHGLAFLNGFLYVAEEGKIVRFRDDNRDLKADDKPEVIVPDLPTKGGGHYTRTVEFGSDSMMYVSIGSSCNVCEEKDTRRAAVVRYTPDGKEETIFASGLRNSVGITFHPETGKLWGTDNGRDWLGDHLPLEEINIIQKGKHYGWPYVYGKNIPDPKYGHRAPNNSLFAPPVFELPAHWAPLGLSFYFGNQFPREYHGDLFVACRGSWNSSVKVGYKVIRIRIENGVPVGMDDFLTGFLTRGEKVLGRPVDIVVAPDGAVFVSDDYTGSIYRVVYGLE